MPLLNNLRTTEEKIIIYFPFVKLWINRKIKNLQKNLVINKNQLVRIIYTGPPLLIIERYWIVT